MITVIDGIDESFGDGDNGNDHGNGLDGGYIEGKVGNGDEDNNRYGNGNVGYGGDNGGYVVGDGNGIGG